MYTNYLIDYENVSYRGLNGLRDLPEEDQVFLFYTQNANQINLDAFERVKARLHVIRVNSGKQSLDIHLASWLGNLLGREPSADADYVIVSNDTDFDGIICFWNQEYRNDRKIVRRGMISKAEADSEEPKGSQKIDRCERIRQEITGFFRTHSEKDEAGRPRLPLSVLCNRLNHVAAYHSLRKSSGKRPRDFLAEKFADLIVLKNTDRTEWVYLASEAGTSDMAEKQPVTDEETFTAEDRNSENTAPVENTEISVANAEKRPGEEENSTDLAPSEKLPPEDSAEETTVPEQESKTEECKQDLIQQLTEAGFEQELAEFIRPILEECMKAQSPKTMLCKQLRHVYGSKIGNEYYKSIRDTLKM